MDEAEFDDETFAGTEQRLDEINHLKAKYGHTIDEILASLEKKKEKQRSCRIMIYIIRSLCNRKMH